MIKLDAEFRKKLYNVFEFLSQTETEEFSQGELNSITFSPGFEFRMKKIFHRYDHFWYYWLGNQVKRVAAIVILALGITFGTTLSVEALREPFLNFIAETFEKFTKISFPDETGTEIEEFIPLEPIEPSYVPAGFEITKRETGFSGNMITYRKGDLQIIYSQDLKDGAQIYLDTEDATTEKIIVNGTEILQISEDDGIILFFSTESYVFSISGTAPKDELLMMAQSILK